MYVYVYENGNLALARYYASTAILGWELAVTTGVVLESSTGRVLATDTDWILSDEIS